MPENPFDPQVIIPYSQLCDLLQASVELKQIRVELKRLKKEVSGLHCMQVEIMDYIKEIE